MTEYIIALVALAIIAWALRPLKGGRFVDEYEIDYVERMRDESKRS